ncbi:hypothetical protein HY745_06030 [Candidatus Desantisbacteria bacterium]|nr:hypothetical protein [Candidatus Desantisbacteria bacterium]
MYSQIKYREKVIKELQNIPDEVMPKLLKVIHCLKSNIKKRKRNIKIKKKKDPLFELGNIAVETGIKDLAENHNFYLYGVPK